MTSSKTSHPATAALRERVKELTCLYGIAQLTTKPGVSLGEILQGVAELLPPAWQYPEVTSARLVVDGSAYVTEGCQEGPCRQMADIRVAGAPRGSIEVFYSREMPGAEEGPFLEEERRLINAVAAQVALIIERRETEMERLTIQEQLRHADRLATIGQLAAGVAHELNEPLVGILGLAQLMARSKDLSGRNKEDIEKIKALCLQAREIIRQLLAFARQALPEATQVDLNRAVEDGLAFFETRCAQDGVELVRVLAPGLPPITCDPVQLNQILVNLIVNALQAMPKGGTLTVRTRPSERGLSLVVEDTGMGMAPEVLEKVFVPFFTTKEVGEGTGLGLPVVHGIVTAHGGGILVESKPGRGTQVEVRLPLTAPERIEENR